MEIRLTERHIVALNFLLIAVLAYFAALSVNDIVAFRLTPTNAPIGHVVARPTDDGVATKFLPLSGETYWSPRTFRSRLVTGKTIAAEYPEVSGLNPIAFRCCSSEGMGRSFRDSR